MCEPKVFASRCLICILMFSSITYYSKENDMDHTLNLTLFLQD